MPTVPIYTQYTPAHRVLFEEHFKATLPVEELVRVEFQDLPGSGEFYSAEWHRCVVRKFEILLRAVDEDPEEVLVWCDADIQFFPGFSTAAMLRDLENSGRDVLFQQEGIEPRPGHKEANTGVFIARKGASLRAFFEEVVRRMEQDQRPNDQNTINHFLPEQKLITWGYLSPRYYARTHGFPPGREIVLHHANTTTKNSVVGKRRQMALVRSAVTGGFAARLLACMTVLLHKGMPSLLRAIKRQFQRGPHSGEASSK